MACWNYRNVRAHGYAKLNARAKKSEYYYYFLPLANGKLTRLYTVVNVKMPRRRRLDFYMLWNLMICLIMFIIIGYFAYLHNYM
jgi:hypothetical protein